MPTNATDGTSAADITGCIIVCLADSSSLQGVGRWSHRDLHGRESRNCGNVAHALLNLPIRNVVARVATGVVHHLMRVDGGSN